MSDDCQRALCGLPVALSADAEVADWPSYCVVVTRTYLFVWYQFL